MRKIRTGFTEAEIRLLESNPNISRVSGKNISYVLAFKLAAVQASEFIEANEKVLSMKKTRPSFSLSN